MPQTRSGKALLSIDAYVGSFLEGPTDIIDGKIVNRGHLRTAIEAIEAEAIEIGRRQTRKEVQNVEPA